MDKIQFSATYSRMLARALDLKRDALLPLLAGTGIKPEDIEFERVELTPSEQYQIIDNALQLSQQPALGLVVGEQAELSTHGILGLASMSAATLYEVLEIFARYHHVRAPFFDLKLETAEDYLVIKLKTLDKLNPAANQFLIEAGTSMMQSMVEHIVGREVKEAQLSLPLGDKADWVDYRDYFHGTVTRSEDDYARYSIPLRLAKSPSPTRDDVLRQRAEEGCKSILEKVDAHSTSSGKVEELLTVHGGTHLTLVNCAKLLNVSPRTLIRRLKAEGTTFNTLIEARRKAQAVRLLASPGISVEAISLELGYDHAANFRRAFKRWFKMTPSQYRQQQLDT
ncbi:MAG: AraC family transcriptional regulator [Gammaproteobacteria bacterium]|nr:AraC family transcriptional regulator [Gammaproteobacteria bacterium]